jgi:glycosyltransferase involved in cell wall biosynthesis
MTASATRPRVALVHDWLTGMRGGEKVLQVLCGLYPQADLFTLVHVPGSVTPVIERHRRIRSWIGALPRIHRYYRHLLPLFPIAVEQFDLDDYDLVLSTSHCVAKSAIAPGRARHLCYCHSPMRYAWDQFEAYFGEGRLGRAGGLMRLAMNRLARWDAATADRPHRYVANSQHVAGRIARYYNRRSAIVHPPVDTDYFHPAAVPPESFALVVSALVPYKRVEIALDACQIAGVPLVVVGQGPERPRLERRAQGDVRFLGAVSDADVRDLYRRSLAVLQPGEEDFGIAAVEAQACGRPVVALGRGGALETVGDGTTGLHVPESSPEAFADALRRLPSLPLDPAVIRAHAERFATPVFTSAMRRQIDDLMAASPETARW